jgi:predicted RNA-binding protein YlqC (UPF0109 family)
MEDLITFVIRSIVDSPDDVSVSLEENGDVVRYNLSVAQDDIGQVIGRRGRTVRAMRTLVRAAAARTGQTVEFEIVEE